MKDRTLTSGVILIGLSIIISWIYNIETVSGLEVIFMTMGMFFVLIDFVRKGQAEAQSKPIASGENK